MKYKCYLCQHEWDYEYSPQYRYIECPNCGKSLIEEETRKSKNAMKTGIKLVACISEDSEGANHLLLCVNCEHDVCPFSMKSDKKRSEDAKPLPANPFDSDTPNPLGLSIKSDDRGSERRKIIDKIKEINKKVRSDPEVIKRKQELCEELSKLTSEDLSKRITSRSDKGGSK